MYSKITSDNKPGVAWCLNGIVSGWKDIHVDSNSIFLHKATSVIINL